MATCALALAYWIRFDAIPVPAPPGLPALMPYVEAAPALSACLVLVFALMGNYSNHRSSFFADEIFGIIGALAASALAVFAALIIYPPDRLVYSRLTFGYWILIAGILIGLSRYAIRRIERRQRARGVGTARCLVIGRGHAADQLVQRIKMFPDFGYQLIAMVADQLDASLSQSDASAEITKIIERDHIDVVFVALPHVRQERVLELIASNRRREVEFRVVPTTLEMLASQVEPDELAGIPLLRIRRSFATASLQMRAKRLFDMILALLGLVLVVPLMALIGLLIRITSPGPILIRQERVGLNDRTFQMLKFRSMRVDAERMTGPVWASSGDTRRTTIGILLRRFSLDELPQLWNVLKGDMSLVGPRPERPVFATDFGNRMPAYAERHRVRPGVTGWAQVNDLRGMTSIEDRLVYDLYYAERWNLAFDVKIILTTAFRIFTSKHAY